MPNWAHDDGRYYYTPKGKHWTDNVEIPHAPVELPSNCSCLCCIENKPKKKKKSVKKDVKSVIRLQFLTTYCITAEEYEQLEKELIARFLAGELTILEKIGCQILADNRYRYKEIKEE